MVSYFYYIVKRKERNMNYQLIIFDADETLFDFKKSERIALLHTLNDFDIQYDEAYHLKLYQEINQAVWKELEQGLLTQAQLNVLRFSRLGKRLGIGDDKNRMAERYKEHLARASFLFDESLDLVKSLGKKYRLIILSNGLKDVQNGRLRKSVIADYFEEILISEEEGIAKPDPAFFQLAFDRIGFTDRKGALIVGDSLSSDIQGGINFGIDTCWYRRETAPAEPHHSHPKPTYVISELTELLKILSIQ